MEISRFANPERDGLGFGDSGLDASLAERFEAVAARHGHRPALISGDRRWFYGELNAIANRLAHAIMARGGKRGDRVVILMAHDAPAIATMLAGIKAARLAVVLNPTHPIEQLRETVKDADASLIVADDAHANLATQIAGPGLALLRFEEGSRHSNAGNPSIAVDPGEPAFLAYTSGSTAGTKGVLQTHRQRLSNAMVYADAWQLTVEDRVALLGSLASGQGHSITFATLLTGATLLPFPAFNRGVTGLRDWMIDNDITVYISSASVFRNFIKTVDRDARFPRVHAIQLMSEAATSDDFKLFQRHFPANCMLVHTLSSSETGNIALSRWSHSDKVPEGKLPVGLITKEHDILFLDEQGDPVQPGEIGEIVIRSRYIAAGYWRNSERTAGQFSDAGDGSGRRVFHTGDLARVNASGHLEFCGRRDDRVKIRGHRISLSDIEQALHRLPGIERAAVEAVHRDGFEPLLVGFVAACGDQSWSQLSLRRALRAVLPDYMVPSEFAVLREFPLTSAGKVDRRKLRQEFRPKRERSRKPPETATEHLLAAIWAEVFEIDSVDRDENFFSLGGDSLIAALVSASVHHAVGVQLDLAMFTDNATLVELARVIDRLRAERTEESVPFAQVRRLEPPPVSFAQERIWRISQTPGQAAAYTMSRIYRISGPLDRELLRECMDHMAQRHEMLRTSFAASEPLPVQIVNAPAPTVLPFIDLRGNPDPQEQALAIFGDGASRVFDLTQAPLLQFLLARLRDDEHWLLRVSHHILSDNVSWELYFSELAQLYSARLQGERSPLPVSAALQYGDYAAWQRRVFDRASVAYRRSVEWWKDNLSGAPQELMLPFARAQAETAVIPADGRAAWRVEPHVAQRLNTLSAAHSATRGMVRLAAFAALIAVESRCADVTVGMYASGRNSLPLRNVFGDFSNLLTLRFQYNPGLPFVDWLSVVRNQVVKADANGAIPYDELCEELRRQDLIPPTIKVIFHVPLPRGTFEFVGLRLTRLERVQQSYPWGFTFDFDEQNESDGSKVEFDPRLYDPAGVSRFIDRYQRLLDAVSRHPDKLLDELFAMSCARSIAATSVERNMALPT